MKIIEQSTKVMTKIFVWVILDFHHLFQIFFLKICMKKAAIHCVKYLCYLRISRLKFLS